MLVLYQIPNGHWRIKEGHLNKILQQQQRKIKKL